MTTAEARRPRVALIMTTFFKGSHSDVIGNRLLDGYELEGQWREPSVEVVSAYLELLGDPYGGDDPRVDIGTKILADHGVPQFESVAEAIGLGSPGVAVDAVLVIGEHGGYEDNVYGQRLYPRKRLLDAVISTMWGAGKFVPVFTDKQLSWRFRDARRMVDDCQRFGVPLMAGSSVPLAWRTGDLAWPAGAQMDHAVTVAFGGADIYGPHILELAQSFIEHRAGGESGVARVLGLKGDQARAALNSELVDSELYEHTLDTLELTAQQRNELLTRGIDLFHVEYADGLVANHVVHDAMGRWGFSARGPEVSISTRTWLQQGPQHGHFSYLARNIEEFFTTGEPLWPLERVLLTTGILDTAMRSRHFSADEGAHHVIDTPELGIEYQPFDPPLVIDAVGKDPLVNSQ